MLAQDASLGTTPLNTTSPGGATDPFGYCNLPPLRGSPFTHHRTNRLPFGFAQGRRGGLISIAPLALDSTSSYPLFNKTGVPLPNPSVFDALPLFTPISKFPLDPT